MGRHLEAEAPKLGAKPEASHDGPEAPKQEVLGGAVATTGPKVRAVTRPSPRNPAGKARASTAAKGA